MGRSPCCSKEGLNRGAWTALEDKILTAYIKAHGEGKWRNLPKRAGLKRCGKSCRLRWLNYLRPDIKRGNISHDEEELIIRLHKLLGNRWSLIAGRLPGRTDNEIKNYWNTTLGKKANAQSVKSEQSNNNSRLKKLPTQPIKSSNSSQSTVVRTKATRCTKVFVSLLPPEFHSGILKQPGLHVGQTSFANNHHIPYPVSGHRSEFNCNIGTANDEHGLQSYHHDHDLDNFLNLEGHQFQPSHVDGARVDYDNNYQENLSTNFGHHQRHDEPSLSLEGSPLFKEWNAGATSVSLEDNAILDLESLAFLLDSGEWPCQ